MDDLILHNNVVYEKVGGLFSGYVKSEGQFKQMEPFIVWTGSKLPWDEYRKLISFFRWSYKETKGEAQARFAYNEAMKMMKVVVFPQEKSSGLSTKELADHPIKAVLMESLIKEGYELCGTAHHHCSCSAFQSGTDKSDESTQAGVHITVGKMDEKKLDLDCRIVFRGTQYKGLMMEWIDIPVFPDCPDELKEAVEDFMLKSPKEIEFPEEWKNMIISPPKKEYYQFNGYGIDDNGQDHPWQKRHQRKLSKAERKKEKALSKVVGFQPEGLSGWDATRLMRLCQKYSIDAEELANDIIMLADDPNFQAADPDDAKFCEDIRAESVHFEDIDNMARVAQLFAEQDQMQYQIFTAE